MTQVWGTLLTLLLTPYIVRSLGAEKYGTFSLVLVVANYISIMDLGFEWAATKFVAECAAEKDYERMGRIVRTSFWTTLVLGVVLCLGLLIMAPWLVNSVFNTPTGTEEVLTIGILLSGTCLVGLLLSNLCFGILKGLQRFDLVMGCSALSLTLRMAGYVVLLAAGYDLIALWVLTLASFGLSLLLALISLRSLIPSFSLFPQINLSELQRILGFSIYSFGTRLSTMPYFYLDKLFISAMLPISSLAYYVIPFNLAQRIGGLGGAAVSVLFPSASELKHDRAGLCELYRHAARLAYPVILPGCVVVAMVGPEFIGHWLGKDFREFGEMPLILTALGFAASVLGSIDGTFTEALGRPRIRTIIYGTLACISLPACYLLTEEFGITGTATTVALAFCLGALADVLYFQLAVMKDWWFLRSVLPRSIILVASGCVVGWASLPCTGGLTSTLVVGVTLYALMVCIGVYLFHGRQKCRDYVASTLNLLSDRLPVSFWPGLERHGKRHSDR